MVKISIIVPVYNVENYIGHCIDNLRGQTLTNIEIILVDDGSTDSSGVICDRYKEKDPRIRVIHKKNEGPASARNAGIDLAAGQYIMFCDSDDYVSPLWCEHMAEHISCRQDNYIFCGIRRLVRGVEEKKASGTAIRSIEMTPEQFPVLEFEGKVGYVWNVLYYNSVLEKYSLRFPTDVIVEDLPFTLSYMAHMKRMTYTGTCDYYYIQDDRETLSRKYSIDGYTRWREKYDVTMKYIRKLDYTKQEELIRKTCNYYLYPFLNALNHTFDRRNHNSLIQKISFNSQIVKSRQFQECLSIADIKNENQIYIYLLRKKAYFAAYLVSLFAKMI